MKNIFVTKSINDHNISKTNNINQVWMHSMEIACKLIKSCRFSTGPTL